MCKHKNIKTIATTCFFGPVSKDQNPAAHGNITDKDKCLDCGAIRYENINGMHVETGAWISEEEEGEGEKIIRQYKMAGYSLIGMVIGLGC